MRRALWLSQIIHQISRAWIKEEEPKQRSTVTLNLGDEGKGLWRTWWVEFSKLEWMLLCRERNSRNIRAPPLSQLFSWLLICSHLWGSYLKPEKEPSKKIISNSDLHSSQAWNSDCSCQQARKHQDSQALDSIQGRVLPE